MNDNDKNENKNEDIEVVIDDDLEQTEGLSAVDFTAVHLFATASSFYINHCTKTVMARFETEKLLKTDLADTSTAIDALDEWLTHEDEDELFHLKNMFISAKKLGEGTVQPPSETIDPDEYRLLLFVDEEGAAEEQWERERCECGHRIVEFTEAEKLNDPLLRRSEFERFKNNIDGILFNERTRTLVIVLDDETYMSDQKGDQAALSIDDRVQKTFISLNLDTVAELQNMFVEKFDAVEEVLRDTHIAISYKSDDSDEEKSRILDLMLEGYELPDPVENGSFRSGV